MTDVQVDLMDMHKLAEENENNNYGLVAIDVLSKQIFAVPVKTKETNDMLDAFKILLKQMPMKPHRIFSDKGKEFENKKIKKYFKDEDIEKYKPNSSTVKASVVERAIRTLKQRLYRYMSQKQTIEWIYVLPKIVNGINNSKSRTHGMRPAQVNFDNAQNVWEKIYGPQSGLISPIVKRKPRYNENDHVRMSKNKGVFHKGYIPSWDDEIIRISKVKKQDPPRYMVKDEKGEPFDGYFYEPDLQKVKKDETTTYRIEKILRTKKDKKGNIKYFVKFFDESHPQWIDESHIAPLE
jgi:hypothetical protein